MLTPQKVMRISMRSGGPGTGFLGLAVRGGERARLCFREIEVDFKVLGLGLRGLGWVMLGWRFGGWGCIMESSDGFGRLGRGFGGFGWVLGN